MARDSATLERLEALLSQLTSLTKSGSLHWRRQLGSAHRYARWKNNLLIIGPVASGSLLHPPRYFLLTPFDSTEHLEICSTDEQLGPQARQLIEAVDAATERQPPTDSFAVTAEFLEHLVD